MLKSWMLGAAMATAFAVGSGAQAGTVFDNGGANVPGSAASSLADWQVADDFILSQDFFVTGGSFVYGGEASADLALTYYFYANEVLPGGYNMPGEQLATGSLTILDQTYLGDPGYISHSRATFSFETAFAAQANTRYWLGLRSFEGDVVSWAVVDFTPSLTWQQSKFDHPPYWRGFDFEHAFALTGEAPEPATWALMISGFGLAGTALRRRRAKDYAVAQV